MAEGVGVVAAHPIRLTVSDQLERSRLTVFFRLLLAIPHYIWAGLWTIVAFAVVIASWPATLIRGRSPLALHNFLAAYVRYVTHLYAYLNLAANPYPSFDGRAEYPIDVIIQGPQGQNRWSVLFRAVTAVPALMLALALSGAPTAASRQGAGGSSLSFNSYGSGLLHAVALLAWFAILARGRMPRGLRDAASYALAYGAQFWGYVFLLTDRYPTADPFALLTDLPVRDDPIRVEADGDLRRSRLTVFLRLPLSFPLLFWLGLWAILALLATIVSWFALLLTGRQPLRLNRFLSAYLRYQLHVYAFANLVGNPFPGFTGRAGSYPVEAVIAAPVPQSRWKVGLRLILAIPALILMGAYGGLMLVVAILGWFAGLITARMPLGLRNAGVLALRYQAQAAGYLLLLSDSYPYSGPYLNPGLGAPAVPSGPPAPAPLPATPAPAPLPELGL